MTATDDFLAQYREALMAQAKRIAEAEYLEHRRKALLAEIALETGEKAMAKAEMRARASGRYATFLDELRAARTAEQEARATVTHMAARLQVWVMRESARRNETRRGS